MTTVHRAPSERIFYGCSFSLEEIELARAAMPLNRLTAEIGALRAAFEARDHVAVKLCCERLRDSAHDLAHGAAQIEALSGGLARTFTAHMARRGM